MIEFAGHCGSWDLLRGAGPSAQWVQLCVSLCSVFSSRFEQHLCLRKNFVYFSVFLRVIYGVISERVTALLALVGSCEVFSGGQKEVYGINND